MVLFGDWADTATETTDTKKKIAAALIYKLWLGIRSVFYTKHTYNYN